MSVEIEIVEEPARACAAMMVGAAAGGGHVVLAGGSTPRAAYEEFVRAVGAVGVDLSQTTLWFGDDRCVPPDDERSNYLMVKRSLLDPLGDNAPRSPSTGSRASSGQTRPPTRTSTSCAPTAPSSSTSSSSASAPTGIPRLSSRTSRPSGSASGLPSPCPRPGSSRSSPA